MKKLKKKNKKRKTKNEKRKTKNEKRKTKNEKQKTKNEKRSENVNALASTLGRSFPDVFFYVTDGTSIKGDGKEIGCWRRAFEVYFRVKVARRSHIKEKKLVKFQKGNFTCALVRNIF
jgi:hypothetical protein